MVINEDEYINFAKDLKFFAGKIIDIGIIVDKIDDEVCWYFKTNDGVTHIYEF